MTALFLRTDLSRTLAAVACTVVLSATCVLGAVGPAAAASLHTAEIAVHPQA